TGRTGATPARGRPRQAPGTVAPGASMACGGAGRGFCGTTGCPDALPGPGDGCAVLVRKGRGSRRRRASFLAAPAEQRRPLGPWTAKEQMSWAQTLQKPVRHENERTVIIVFQEQLLQ